MQVERNQRRREFLINEKNYYNHRLNELEKEMKMLMENVEVYKKKVFEIERELAVLNPMEVEE